MTAIVFSATNLGFEGQLIEVECDASNGLPTLQIVGLGNKAIDEAKERVRSAIKNSGLEFPKKRVTINLAPANLPKHGAHFDLPIAIALLAVNGQLPADAIKNTLFAGELALDGSLRDINCAITCAEIARSKNKGSIILPSASAPQAALLDDVTVYAARTLREVFLHLTEQQPLTICRSVETSKTSQVSTINEIKGQDKAKRALLIAAAGRHNILFSGPPGAGKTMLARALTSLLPPLTRNEIIEVTKMHNLAGATGAQTERPFRSPHHTASHIALTGGGSVPRPGEISLANHGVLFLDELPEYSRQSLEALRQPLEDRIITIARANDSITFPANFMLVATQNPCPCGYFGDQEKECVCHPAQIDKYQKKISGPLLDRIDMIVPISRVDPVSLLRTNQLDTISEHFDVQIQNALTMQAQRFGQSPRSNSSVTNKEMRSLAKLSPSALTLLERSAQSLYLSARTYFKVIKVARTIADLEKSTTIEQIHIAEALQYRTHKSN